MRWVLLADPGHARVASMQAALSSRGLPPAEVLSYAHWLAAPERLLALLAEPCWLKLEAAGEDAAAQAALVARGAALRGLPVPAVRRHGEIAHGSLVHAGLADALSTLAASLRARPWVHCVNRPETLIAMADKLGCQYTLAARGLPVPALLGPVGDFGTLTEAMQAHGARRVFVKPRYGSSASGVLALETDGRGRYAATSSVEFRTDEGRLYNSLRIRRYQGAEVGCLVDRLAGEELYAERWIAKPRAGRACFDARLVVLAGRPAHRVARLSARPMTNLHLGNARAELADLLGPESITRAEALAVAALSAFPGAQLAGVDLIADAHQATVLELNACGDWLPRLVWQGRSVHEALVDTLSGLPSAGMAT
jgi:glutathione synthase/RimK-type ligase-like ATP-grasp enzyme